MPDTSPLHALTAGELDRWRGLPPGLGTADVDQVLGPRIPGGDVPSIAFGSAMVLRRYPPALVAPLGIRVWFSADESTDGALLVEVDEPRLTRPLEDLLDGPEADLPSLLGTSRRQLVYAERGLTVHVSMSGEPYRLYGYEPTALATYLESPLRYVASHRIPLPD